MPLSDVNYTTPYAATASAKRSTAGYAGMFFLFRPRGNCPPPCFRCRCGSDRRRTRPERLLGYLTAQRVLTLPKFEAQNLRAIGQVAAARKAICG